MYYTNCLVSGSFHSPSGLLFSFPSRYFFAIGLELYLGLDVYATRIPTRITTHGTQDTFPHSFSNYFHGAITLYGKAFQLFKILRVGIGKGPYSTSLSLFREDSVCPLPLSIAFTHGISIDFFSSRY